MKQYTHTLQYEQRDGSWTDGYLAYTEREAEGVALAGRQRTGRGVRVVPLPEPYDVQHERDEA